MAPSSGGSWRNIPHGIASLSLRHQIIHFFRNLSLNWVAVSPTISPSKTWFQRDFVGLYTARNGIARVALMAMANLGAQYLCHWRSVGRIRGLILAKPHPPLQLSEIISV